MNTDSNIHGNEHTQGGQEIMTDALASYSAGTAAAFGEQPGRSQAVGRGASSVVVWPHFNIGSDGRAYA